MSKFNIYLIGKKTENAKKEPKPEPKPEPKDTIKKEPKIRTKPKTENEVSLSEFNEIKTKLAALENMFANLENTTDELRNELQNQRESEQRDVALEAVMNFVVRFYRRWFDRGQAVTMKILVDAVIEKYGIEIHTEGGD